MKGRLVHRSALCPSEEDAMFAVFERHFVGVPREVFQADLDGKNWVVLLDSGRGTELAGFSTLHLYDERFRGEPLTVVYSGDTIVDPSAWASSPLPQLWIGAVNNLRREYAKGPLYWLLLVSGFRTYRFLSTFWRRFHPRHDVTTPEDVHELTGELASRRFGRSYDPEKGIVRFARPPVLSAPLRGIPRERLRDPHVAFFARKNPWHAGGDELVCLTELAEWNLTRAGERMWRAGERAFAAQEAS